MSRIGELPIVFKGTSIDVKPDLISFTGPFGTNSVSVPFWLKVNVDNNEKILHIEPEYIGKDKSRKALWGTLNRLLNNAANGVIKKFESKIKLSGLGFKCEIVGDKMTFFLSYNTPRVLMVPKGLTVKVEQGINLTISGINLQQIGEFTNIITKLRKYNVYSGKGLLWTSNKKRVYIKKPTKSKGK